MSCQWEGTWGHIYRTFFLQETRNVDVGQCRLMFLFWILVHYFFLQEMLMYRFALFLGHSLAQVTSSDWYLRR